jgi:hypothetical protein
MNVLPHAINFCSIKVAQLDWKFCTTGDNVDGSGLRLDVSHIAHLSALVGPYDVAHGEHVL